MVEKRNIALSVVLTIVTCGIYGIFWYIGIHNDTKYLSGEVGLSGLQLFIFTVLTCGVYSLYWAYTEGEKLDKLKKDKGLNSSNSGILYLILSFIGLGIVAYALMQDSLNKMIEA